MNLLLAAFVAVMGGGLSVQPLINARLAAALGHPVYGAMISVLISTVTLILVALVMRLPGPQLGRLVGGPVWLWAGGVIGAFVVLSALMAAPRLGAATTVALFIAGQLAASIAIDHYGLLGVPVHPVDLKRALGLGFLMTGVVLIRWA